MSEPSTQLERDTNSPAAMVAPFLWCALGLFVLGVGFFRSPLAMVAGQEMSLDRAVFTVVNAITLTGFQLSINADQYRPAGRVVIVMLTIGGASVIFSIGATLLSLLLLLPYSRGQILRTALMLQLFAAVVSAAVFISPGRPLLEAAFAGLSAVTNSGLWIGAKPTVTDWRLHAVLLPLAMLGSIGITVLLELRSLAQHRRPLSQHARIVLLGTAMAYAGCFLALFLLRWGEAMHGWGEARRVLASCSAATINARSAGLPVEELSSWPRAAAWIVMPIMLLGGATASAAGGIKLNTVYLLWRGARDALDNKLPGRAFGAAIVTLALLLVTVLMTQLILLASCPDQDAGRLMLLAVSATCSAGLSHETLNITGSGLFALSVAMLAGRAISIGALWWLISSGTKTDVGVG